MGRESLYASEGWSTAEIPLMAHSCNCIGCCDLCGTCRTWHGHTKAYCDLLQRQLLERADALREWARSS